MMRIRMLVEMPAEGTRNGQPWPAKGDEAELPTAEAAHLVAAGVAEEVAAPRPAGLSKRRRAAPSGGE